MTSVHFLVMLFKDTKNSGTLTWCFEIINKPLILCLAPLPDNPILYKSILSNYMRVSASQEMLPSKV